MPTGPAAHVALKETYTGEPKLRERGVMAIGSASDSCLDPPLILVMTPKVKESRAIQFPEIVKLGFFKSSCGCCLDQLRT